MLVRRTLSVNSEGMALYSRVLAQNIRAARSRKGLQQAPLAARMRALGHREWRAQTVSATEKAKRRVTAEEVFSLAIALETSPPALMTATADDKTVDFPGGSIDFRMVVELVEKGRNLGAVQWEGDVPKFLPVAWWPDARPDIPLPGLTAAEFLRDAAEEES